jgi:DNA-3-methyladenine glycosylase II
MQPPEQDASDSRLDEAGLAVAVEQLAQRDADLAAIVARFGLPPLWAREPGFPTLVLMILEQQVSLASARAAYNKLEGATGKIEPASVLQLDDATLRMIGFSRQKTAYTRSLAQALVEERFDLDGLAHQDDDAVRAALVALKGIGPWTAEVYLVMALRRPDAWPIHDLGLLVAAQEVKGLPQRPTPQELAALAEPWRPWRAAAARLLWHHYLSTRARKS